MKNLIIIALALASISIGANAADPTYAAQSITIPTSIKENVTTNVQQVIDCRKQKTVTFQFSFKMTDTGTNGLQHLTFYRSVDGVSYDTATGGNVTTVDLTPNGTTTVCVTTNVDTFGAGYLKLYSWLNRDTAVAATNIAAYYAVKISAP